MPDVTNGVFSDHCYNKMLELYRTPEDEVGSEYKGDKTGKTITNCIIYVTNVLIYGHEKIGRSDRNARLHQLGRVEQDGTKLAKYLVNEIGWNAHYWNPDVNFNYDGTPEHSSSYKDMVVAKKSYYNIPVSGVIINYNKKNKSTKRVWIPSGVNIPLPSGGIPIPRPVNVSNENTAILEKVSKVKFAFGIARGGTHTFLFSFGEVFEVHWDQIGIKLYGKKAFQNYNWYSGVLITPPDSTFASDAV